MVSKGVQNTSLRPIGMRPAVKDVDWNTWFYGCGLPPMPEVDSRMAKEVRVYRSCRQY